jgi:hypothetical protein
MVYETLTAEYSDGDHSIPFTWAAIIKMILDDEYLTGEDLGKFARLCQLLESVYHYLFHKDLANLKLSYQLFSPDVAPDASDANNRDLSSIEGEWISRIKKILIDGNYKEVSDSELETALDEEGLFPVSAKVNFDSFEYYKIYCQGRRVGTATVKSWIPFKKKEVTFEFYNRIVFFFKVKTGAYFRTRKKMSVPGTPEKIYLKYFRNIPMSDLEMIFPDPKPRMKPIHKIKMFIPLVAGLAITIYRLRIDGNPLTEGINSGLILLIAALLAYVFGTFNEYSNILRSFLSEIAHSLYFRNIANNHGVLTTLIDNAEEQECVEAMLGYYFLLKSDQKLTESELDKQVEKWLEEKHNTKVNFEVGDALEKLEESNLVRRDDQGMLSVPSLDEAIRRLYLIWCNVFKHNSAELPCN